MDFGSVDLTLIDGTLASKATREGMVMKWMQGRLRLQMVLGSLLPHWKRLRKAEWRGGRPLGAVMRSSLRK